MNNQFEFVTQHSCSGSTEANIFFHGYSAGHNKKDRKTLLESIPGNFLQHTNIFAFWSSNHYAHLSSSSWWKLGNACLRQFVGTDSLSVQNMAPLAFHFAKDRIDDFAEARKRAELMGALLFIQLKDYLDKNHPHINTLNLIGHSLGGRLVISSLKNIRGRLHPSLSVKDVMLMAAAVEVRADEAKNMRNLIKGRLINAYSKSDWTLLMPVDETCLGRNSVENFENILIDDFGHGDYWPKLAEVFNRTNFKAISPQPHFVADDHARLDTLLLSPVCRSQSQLNEGNRMTMQSPELLLTSLNHALRRLRGACTVLDLDEDIDNKLLAAMRRLLLAEILGNTGIVAIGGSQGAGKTTLMASMYDLRNYEDQWLQGNEGRGEKMPILIQEEEGIGQPQGYVRRLVKDESSNGFKLEQIKVDVGEFQRAVCAPNAEDLLPVLRVPCRYFNDNNQAWLLLPGYEKQERDNRAWQELMRQAMIGAGGCIIVTDETRMANHQQLEIVRDMLQNELKNCKPYIVISKTEAHRHNEERRAELRASAQTTFQVDAESADKHIILSGVDDPEYMSEWMSQLRSAIDDLKFSGQSNRYLQMSHLSAIVGKDLSRVLNDIRSKSRLYFSSDEWGKGGAQVLEDILEKFDDAVDSLREKHHREVDGIANAAFVKAASTMDNTLKDDHEGFINRIGNVFDTSSETKGKMQSLVKDSWQKAAPGYFSGYSKALDRLTSDVLGKQPEEDSLDEPQKVLPQEKSHKLIELGYVHQSGKAVRYSKLDKDKVSDIRILLGNSNKEEEQAYQDASKQLGCSVRLLPAITLEYSRLAFAMPEVCGLNQDYTSPDSQGDNLVAEGVQSLQTGAGLGKTAIKSFATVMAVDVVSDGDSDILEALMGRSTSGDGTETPPAGGPVILHPAAIAVTAVVAAGYVTNVAMTRLRTFERKASAQAYNMLASVRDHHVQHMKTHFDNSMSAVRERVKEKIRTRYRMDEVLMKKDRLAVALADVSSIVSDLRYELDASAAGLQPFLANDDA